jgi:hypothetical protein
MIFGIFSAIDLLITASIASKAYHAFGIFNSTVFTYIILYQVVACYLSYKAYGVLKAQFEEVHGEGGGMGMGSGEREQPLMQRRGMADYDNERNMASTNTQYDNVPFRGSAAPVGRGSAAPAGGSWFGGSGGNNNNSYQAFGGRGVRLN